MATVEELIRDIRASAPASVGGLTIARWINNRYTELVSQVKFRHLRVVGELSLEGIYDTGTVTTTRGSTAVTGDSTTFETDISAGAQTDYDFRTSNTWYNIASITNDTALVLSSAFAETAVSAASYEIVRRYYSLASDARWIGDFYFTRLRKQLNCISLDELNILAPGRTLTGRIPTYAAEVNVDSNNYRRYEIYPPPEETELIHYIYWKLPTALTVSSTIPPVIDTYTLKEGVLIDLYRYNKSEALRGGSIEAAAIWRNDEKSQVTLWNRKIKDAIRTSRGSDDLSFILEMFHGFSATGLGEQRTAREYVYDNWSR